MTQPGYWKYESSGVLRPAIEAFLYCWTRTPEQNSVGHPMSETQIATVRAYFRQWIGGLHWRGSKIEPLRRRVDNLTTVQALITWCDDAMDEGIDPL